MAANDDDWVPEEETQVQLLPGRFNCTDLGNAERLVATYRDEIRYCPQRKMWLTWEGTRWRWDEIGVIERMAKSAVRAILREAANCEDDNRRKALTSWSFGSESSKRIKAMVNLAQTESGVPVLLDELDRDPYLLNTPNGTIDLRTAKIREHRKSDLITRTTGVAYDPNASSKLWDKVLKDACGNDVELAQYLQHVAGFSLIGVPLERALFFLYGPPGTSKSTLIDALHAAMGGYVEEADFDTWLLKPQIGGNRGDLVCLAGARLVTSREAKPGAKWDESLLKRITGGDPIKAAAKYEKDVEFRPSFTLLFAANDAPAAREDDDAFWVRMKRVPLTHQIPIGDQDKQLKHKLMEPENAQAILAWAVLGCASYLDRGFPVCTAVEASTSEYRAELDHFSGFLADRTEQGDGYFVSRKDLRKAYQVWAEEVGRKVLLDAKAIKKKLEALKYTELPPRNGYPMWGGLQLKQLGSASEPDEDRWR